MWGTQVRSLVQEDSTHWEQLRPLPEPARTITAPTRCNHGPCAWSLCSATREAAAMRSHALRRRQPLLTPVRESLLVATKAQCNQKINKINKKQGGRKEWNKWSVYQEHVWIETWMDSESHTLVVVYISFTGHCFWVPSWPVILLCLALILRLVYLRSFPVWAHIPLRVHISS